MTTLADLYRAVEIARRLWTDPGRRDRVIAALIRQAARTPATSPTPPPRHP